MKNGPLVSVVIPAYNRAHLIGRSIESVLQQGYKPLEIIVVDDGSTDNTGDLIARKYKQVLYVKQTNRGPSSARNHGARLSSGEIIMFLDSDDVWLPGKVQRQVELLQAAGPEVPCCVTNAILRESSGEEQFSFEIAELHPDLAAGLWLNPAEVLATRFLFFNQVVAVRRASFVRCGGFDENLRLLEDWDLALRLSLLGPWAFTRESFAIWNPDSNESLVSMAMRNLVALRESALIVHNNALARALHAGVTSPRLIDLLRSKVKRTQRELRALRFSSSETLWKQCIGNSSKYLERCRTVLAKRSSGYPQMQVQVMIAMQTAEHMEVIA